MAVATALLPGSTSALHASEMKGNNSMEQSCLSVSSGLVIHSKFSTRKGAVL
jgi:hypothetical protein